MIEPRRTDANDEGDFIIFRDEESAKEFMESCQQCESLDEQDEWLGKAEQKELDLQRKEFAEQRDALNEVLATLGYCAVTNKEEENMRHYAYGLMNDKSLKDEILRAYYYFIWGASQGKALPNHEEIQSVLDGSENFADIGVIRHQVRVVFNELQRVEQIPKTFTHIETAYDCLRRQLAFLKKQCDVSNEELRVNDELIQAAVAFVLRQQFLSWVCKPLIIAYLANPFAKDVKRIADLIFDQLDHPVQMVEVVDMDSQSMTLKFQKGISRREYLEIWNDIKDDLSKEHSIGAAELLKSRLTFLHCMERMSYGQIAKTYYPEYYDKKINGKQNAEDLVRKAIENHGGIYIELD